MLHEEWRAIRKALSAEWSTTAVDWNQNVHFDPHDATLVAPFPASDPWIRPSIVPLSATEMGCDVEIRRLLWFQLFWPLNQGDNPPQLAAEELRNIFWGQFHDPLEFSAEADVQDVPRSERDPWHQQRIVIPYRYEERMGRVIVPLQPSLWVTQANDFEIGDLIYEDPNDSLWKLALADAWETLATHIVTGTNGAVMFQRTAPGTEVIVSNAGLDPAKPAFLSGVDPGKRSNDPPAPGGWAQQVGGVTGGGSFWFQAFNPART